MYSICIYLTTYSTSLLGCLIVISNFYKKTNSWGGARWQRSRRTKFHLVPGIQLDRYQTILNTYELNRGSKKRRAATL